MSPLKKQKWLCNAWKWLHFSRPLLLFYFVSRESGRFWGQAVLRGFCKQKWGQRFCSNSDKVINTEISTWIQKYQREYSTVSFRLCARSRDRERNRGKALRFLSREKWRNVRFSEATETHHHIIIKHVQTEVTRLSETWGTRKITGKTRRRSARQSQGNLIKKKTKSFTKNICVSFVSTLTTRNRSD